MICIGKSGLSFTNLWISSSGEMGVFCELRTLAPRLNDPARLVARARDFASLSEAEPPEAEPPLVEDTTTSPRPAVFPSVVESVW